jgi:hypothetical protein
VQRRAALTKPLSLGSLTAAAQPMRGRRSTHGGGTRERGRLLQDRYL